MKKILLALFTLIALCACSDDESIDGAGMSEFPAFNGTLVSSHLSDGFDYSFKYANVVFQEIEDYKAELINRGFRLPYNEHNTASRQLVQYSKKIGGTK